MSEDQSFADLVRRVRAGDAAAAEQLVREYEPHIRRAVRVRLTDPRLRRLVDSIDICQSVMANFFARAAAGQLDLDTPRELVSLLVTMASNRLIDLHRRHSSLKADRRREVSVSQLSGGAIEGVAEVSSPSRQVAARELLEQVYTRLTPQERRLAEQRASGASWKELAALEGKSADAVRMQLQRAVERVMRELDELQLSDF